MLHLKEHYIINEKGEKTKVVLDIEDYKKIMEELEELESIKAYDEAKDSGETAVNFDEAIKDIKQNRK